jgi:hypothetical protein
VRCGAFPHLPETTKASGVGDNDVALSTDSLFLLALGNDSSGTNFSNYQLSCAWIAAGVTSTMAFAINNACNHAMTTLGSNHIY